MSEVSGASRSLWVDTGVLPEYAPLAADADTDVCVVGAGIAGLSCAYLLAREGRRVLVLDGGPVAGGETGRTTAHLASALDDGFRAIEKLHGGAGARLAASSHAAAIDRIERICADEAIDADFRRVDGWLFPAPGAAPDVLEAERAAAGRAGLDAAFAEPPIDPFRSGRALRFPDQARIHPLKFMAGLASAIERLGGRIHTGTRMDGVVGGAEVEVHTASGHRVRAAACIVATNSPVTVRVTTHVKQAAYRTFAIAARVPTGSVPDALYWDDGDPYTYIRLQPGDGGGADVLIVGGGDHKTGQRDDGVARLDRLAAWTRERFPMVESIEQRWSGQVFEPNDFLALTGRHPGDMDNVYIHTGDSGHGMTHGVIAGMLLTDLIVGRENAWAGLYDPGRVTLRAAGEFARENLNVAAQYAAWLLPGEVGDTTAIAPGTGRVVRRGAHMVAAFRDEAGVLHERSATCTHLGCVVDWNDLEQSWDCPCHGSRFAPTGDVLTGPALTPLGEPEQAEGG